MARTVIGVFDDWNGADRAVSALMQAGFRREDVSVLSSRDRAPQLADTPDLGPIDDIGGSGKDAGAGAAVGGIAGFVAGIAALAIPGIGPILAAGPLAAGIVGATVGAAAGGLITGFINVGVPAEEAEVYSEHVRRGGTVVAVNTDDSRADKAVAVLNSEGAIDIDSRAESWRQEGWTGAPRREPVRVGEADPGHIEFKHATQAGRAQSEAGGAKVFIW